MHYTCKNCKTKFKVKKQPNRGYCSRKCFLDRNKHWTLKECLFCSKTFKTYPNWIKRGGGKFCSRACASKAHRNRVERICEHCGSKFSVKPCALIHNASRFCSHKCSIPDMSNRDYSYCTGENHPNWQGGISFYPYGSNPYPSVFNDKLKEKIRKRDNHTCQACGMTEEEHISMYGQQLPVHHIDYVKSNCDESNLVAVCHQCNGRANFNREHWINLFRSNQENRMKKYLVAILALFMAFTIQSRAFCADGDQLTTTNFRVDGDGAMWYKPLTEYAATNDTVTTAESGKVFVATTGGAYPHIKFTLPAAEDNLTYTFIQQGTGTLIELEPQSDEQLLYSTAGTGDRIIGPATIGATVTVYSSDDTVWFVDTHGATFTIQLD